MSAKSEPVLLALVFSLLLAIYSWWDLQRWQEHHSVLMGLSIIVKSNQDAIMTHNCIHHQELTDSEVCREFRGQ